MTNQHNSQIRLQELIVFQAIVVSQSITSAADALGLTQSSVSKQLKTLREYFGDELFVRTGSGMVATSKALSLAPQISALIRDFESLNGESTFNPYELERNLIVSTTDEIQHFLLPKLIKKIEEESPKSCIIFKVLDKDFAAKQLESGSVDLVVTLNWHIPEHLKQRRLFSDDFVCIHRQGHPLKNKKLNLKDYLSARHMMVSPRGAAAGPVDEILESYGHQRVVSLACPYFMQVADALKNSDMLLTLPRKACLELIKEHPLVTKELPIVMNPVNYFMFWHKRYDKDSANRWLRDTIYDILHEESDPTALRHRTPPPKKTMRTRGN
jgi:DNA-binding transcriptional LysR family regulator